MSGRARSSYHEKLPEYRIVALGSGGVGKSALTIQFVHARFVDEYDPTIEGNPQQAYNTDHDSYRKQCVVDDESAILDILDTAGQEDYSAMRDSYMQKGDGFLLIFAINSRSSFQELKQIQQQILRVKDVDIYPIILVGNKSDLESERQEIIPPDLVEAKGLAKQFGCRYVETSAKLRHNVEETFHGIVREIRKYQEEQKITDRGPKTSSKTSHCTLS